MSNILSKLIENDNMQITQSENLETKLQQKVIEKYQKSANRMNISLNSSAYSKYQMKVEQELARNSRKFKMMERMEQKLLNRIQENHNQINLMKADNKVMNLHTTEDEA